MQIGHIGDTIDGRVKLDADLLAPGGRRNATDGSRQKRRDRMVGWRSNIHVMGTAKWHIIVRIAEGHTDGILIPGYGHGRLAFSPARMELGVFESSRQISWKTDTSLR